MSELCKHCQSASITYLQGHDGVCCWTCGRSRTGGEWIDVVLDRALAEARRSTLQEAARACQRLAFSWPAPNDHTPQLVQLAVELEHSALAESGKEKTCGRCGHELLPSKEWCGEVDCGCSCGSRK